MEITKECAALWLALAVALPAQAENWACPSWDPATGHCWENGEAGKNTDPTNFMDSARATGAPALWAIGVKGQGTTVAVVDGGFNLNPLPPLLKDKVVNGYDTSHNSKNPLDVEHGTHVTGTVLGMAPEAHLWLGVFEGALARGGSWETLVNQAAQYGVVSANNSWGFDAKQNWISDGEKARMAQLLQAQWLAGVVPVGASGNDADDAQASLPNGLPYMLAVGALQQTGILAGFSNQYGKPGWFVLAPGSPVYSLIGMAGGQTEYEAMQGTSMAAPHVSGALALLKSGAPSATPAQLAEALVATGDPVHYDGNAPSYREISGISDDNATGAIGIKHRFEDLFGTSLATKPYLDWLTRLEAKEGSGKRFTNDELRAIYRIVAAIGYATPYTDSKGNPAIIPPFELNIQPEAQAEKLLEYLAAVGGLFDANGKPPTLAPTDWRAMRVDKAYSYLTAQIVREAGQNTGKTASAFAQGFAGELQNTLSRTANYLVQGRLAQLPASARNDALRQLSPAFFATLPETQQLLMANLHGQAATRLNTPQALPCHRKANGQAWDCLPDEAAAWGQIFATQGYRDGTANVGNYKAESTGALLGATRQTGAWRYGPFGWIARQNVHGEDGKADGDSFGLGFQGAYALDRWFIDAQLGYGYARQDVDRKITVPGVYVPYAPGLAALPGSPGHFVDLAGTLHFRPDSTVKTHSLGFRLAGGYDLVRQRDFSFGLRSEASAVFSHMPGFRESGAGDLNLSVDAYDSRYWEVGAGVELSRFFPEKNLRGSLKLLALYEKGEGGKLAGHLPAGGRFSVPVEQIGQLALSPEMALTWQLGQDFSLSARYRGRFGESYREQAGMAELNWRF
ncbi:MAG: S8 family serine peptidase [Zoogloeaceae bacterium]|nr:S8 family serine peptidase [Zoogloeaceae bacterium]